jgi:hypothetical protein
LANARPLTWSPSALPIDLASDLSHRSGQFLSPARESTQADGGDGLVVVPFGARELVAIRIGVLLPFLAVLEEVGQPSPVGADDGLPVVETEVPGCVDRSVGGQDDSW